MVNTPLRRAGGDYAWAKAFVCAGKMGSPLHNERCLHLRHPAFPIPYDFIPARLALLHSRSLVADRRAGPDRDAHGAARVLVFALSRRPNEKSLSSGPGHL